MQASTAGKFRTPRATKQKEGKNFSKPNHSPRSPAPLQSISFSLSQRIRVLISMMMASNEDHQSNLFFELSSLLFTFLRSPHLALPSSDDHPPPSAPPPPPRNQPARRPMPPVTPAAFASLLLGASLALMICGSVTFVIGFILMPWVLGIVMLFYFLGILSNVTGFWMALFCPTQKEISDSFSPNCHLI